MSEQSSFARVFGLRMLVTLLLSSAVLFPFLRMLEDSRMDTLIATESKQNVAASYVISRLFEERMHNISLLTQAPALRSYIERFDESKRQATSLLFEAMCDSYGIYDQIRLIRHDGQELIRINHDEGSCQASPRQDLQNKATRYYFSQAMTLSAGETYVSPLDLNMERGGIEVPFKPMIRFAAPVVRMDGQTAGVLVLNFAAKNALSEVFFASSKVASGKHSYLLNADGYYLKNSLEPGREFGFMFDRTGDKFGADFPQVWEALSAGKTSIKTDDGLFLMITQRVPSNGQVVISGLTSQLGPEHGRWFIVRWIPNDLLQKGAYWGGDYQGFWLGLYLVLVSLVSYLWSTLRLRNEALAQSTARITVLFDEAPDGILAVDDRGVITMANRQVLQLTGYGSEELLGQNVDMLVPDGRRAGHAGLRQSFMTQMARREMALNQGLNVRCQDGSEFPASISLNTMATPQGPQVIVSMRNIEAQRKAERQLAFYKEMVDTARDCFYMVNLDDGACVIQANDASVRHFGVSKDTLLTLRNPIWQFNAEGIDLAAFIDRLRREQSITMRSDTVVRGERVPVRFSANYFVDSQGRELAYGWFQDISDEVNIERLQEQAKLKAEQASRSMGEFLANMSHELRTPLNSVIGLTWLMNQRQDLSAEAKDEVKRIHSAGTLLLNLVNDILDLSKLDAGEINLEHLPFRLDSILADVRSLMSVQADQKGVALRVKAVPIEVETRAMGDPTRLRQILLNLVGNAVKFTEKGQVTLSVELDAPPSASGSQLQPGVQWLRFVVEDTGIGIEASVLPSLFRAFKQADTSTTRKFGGTGLGLSLVKQLSNVMGGDVTVTSEFGQGSRFVVSLPLSIDEQGQNESDQPFRVLIAEDDPVQMAWVSGICETFGWQVDAVNDGQELVQRFEALFQANERVDCLIVDWRMPKMDGLEALFHIHQNHRPDQLPGTLMITGHDLEELEKSPHADLPDVVVHKPVDVSDLFNKVSLAFFNHFGHTQRLQKSSDLNTEDLIWLSGVKVLVVDDSPMNLDVATKILELQDATVFTCANGAEAVEWLQRPEHVVDAVLMDVQMPVMDGNTAVSIIRQTERLRELPVLALTAGALASEREKSMAAGMDAYLTKPFNPDHMVRAIREQVERRRQIAVPVVKRSAPVANANEQWPNIAGLDIEAVRNRLQGDMHMFAYLLREFVRDKDHLIKDVLMREGVDLRSNLAARMHKFAGSAGLMGANELFDLAKQIENELIDQPDADVDEALDRLANNYKAICAAIAPVLAQMENELNQQANTALDLEQLANLREALTGQKISAVKLYQGLEASLREAMAAEDFEALSQAMTSLDFDKAVTALGRLAP